MANIIKKIGILGDSGAGKRTLVRKTLCTQPDVEFYLEKLGVTVGKADFEYVCNSKPVKMSLLAFDMTGKEKFDDFRSKYCEGVEGAAIVARSDAPNGIRSMEDYAEFVYKTAGKVPIAFVVNKVAGHPMLGIEHHILEEKWANKYDAEIYYLNFKRCKPKTLMKPFRELGKRMLEGCEAGPWDEPV